MGLTETNPPAAQPAEEVEEVEEEEEAEVEVEVERCILRAGPLEGSSTAGTAWRV